ncbi:hypothetical protein FQZ97_1154050 [compost metagenome]
MALPLRDSAVGSRPEPLRVTMDVGPENRRSEKSICFLRGSVTVMEDSTASILRAFSEGISPSKSLVTQVHLTLSSAQMALPRSISKPCNEPSGAVDSKGG